MLLSRAVMRTVFLLSVIVALLPAPATVHANGVPDPLFQDHEALDVTITAALTTLISERSKDEYLEGAFQYVNADGETVDFDLDIRTRGNFRHRTCEFPPITLNLKRKQAAGTLFDGQNKLKLVIQCDKGERYEQMVLREYLAYRFLNAVTDKSYRVRLLRVRYIDTDENIDDVVRFAFVIEHKSRLAKRLGREVLRLERTSVPELAADYLNLTSIFQYMIGNTDFSPVAGPPGDDCCHNYVLFGDNETPILAIPYDFDQSGLVNAPYAIPNERFKIRNVRQRVYRGRCVNNRYVEDSLTRFRQRRDTIFSLIDGQEGLEPGVRKKITQYIGGFYELIDDPRDVENRIVRKCV